VRLTVVGCSPAWPNPGGAQSGYLIEGPGRLLIDCGPGVLSRLRALDGGGWPRIDAIFLTHMHIDHWADLVGWCWGTHGGSADHAPRTQLWVAEGQVPALHEIATVIFEERLFEGVFDIVEYPVGRPFAIAGFDALALPVRHYEMPTYGLRLAHGGRTLAFSSDTAPCGGIVELARDADLFVCEATLADGDVEGALRGHLTAPEALAAHAASGARRLLLTHRPYERPAPAGIELARDGLVIELGTR
jgi:ribonuclease BN (tRNA processing enzyme)